MINIQPGKLVNNAKTYIQRKRNSKIADKISAFSESAKLGELGKNRINEIIQRDMFIFSKKGGIPVRNKSFLDGIKAALKK